MKNVLSTFDGLSSLQHILRDRLKINDIKYFASEIDPYAIEVTQYHFPKTIQLGDVRNITNKDISKQVWWLLSGGSPCQSFSISGRRRGMITSQNMEVTSYPQYIKLKKEGTQFEGEGVLFWEYVRLWKTSKAKYFFFENVKMNTKWETIISKELGVQPIRVNANVLTSQNRERLYWTNLFCLPFPTKVNITANQIIKNAVGGAGTRTQLTGPKTTVRRDQKFNCITRGSNTRMVGMKNGTVRPLTPEECEQIQTLPIGYTNVNQMTKTNRCNLIGNGWSIDTVTHILKSLKKNN